jgi:hypothetical protein
MLDVVVKGSQNVGLYQVQSHPRRQMCLPCRLRTPRAACMGGGGSSELANMKQAVLPWRAGAECVLWYPHSSTLVEWMDADPQVQGVPKGPDSRRKLRSKDWMLEPGWSRQSVPDEQGVWLFAGGNKAGERPGRGP